MLGIALAIFSPVGRLLKALWSWTTANPMRLVIVALMALCGFLVISNASLRGDIRHQAKVIALRDATIKDMGRASKEARAAQIALNKAVTDKQTDIARKADNAPTDIIDRGRAYADSLQSKDYCRKADSSPESGIASNRDAASDTAVILERADFDILVDNTARLVKVKAWADELVAEGLAVPVE